MTSDERLLIARAKRLKERTGEETARAEVEAILVFKLGRERFSLLVKNIAAIVPFAKVTPVPMRAPHILGVMANKGEVHVVYDLARVLELEVDGVAEPSGYILLLRGDGARAGVRIDQVEAIDFVATDRPPSARSRTFVKPFNSEPLILIESLKLGADA